MMKRPFGRCKFENKVISAQASLASHREFASPYQGPIAFAMFSLAVLDIETQQQIARAKRVRAADASK
jgi:hypothetical protein